jgi:predicted amidohydrolase YtcJ
MGERVVAVKSPKQDSSSCRGADVVIRASEAHTLAAADDPRYRAVAVRGDRIIALATEYDGLNDLVRTDTRVIDAPCGVVLPTFDDTHTHLIFAAQAVHDVPVHKAKDIAEFLRLIRDRAALTPPGEWIRTTTNWQELDLTERRMPTATELDRATDKHPVLVKRGGHNAVANTYALQLAGVTEETPTPPDGVIGRDDDGTLDGRLIDAAMGLVERFYPVPDDEQRMSGLDVASHDYAATGIGTVRDCAVPLHDLDVLLRTHNAGRLGARVRAVVIAEGRSDLAQLDELLDGLEPWRYLADPWLQVWGIKFVLDGGLEAAATEAPYVCGEHCGLLMWDPPVLTEAVERVVRRGWRVGTHAYGDRAVRILLDVYQEVLERNPWTPPRSLVMEHAGLAGPEQRARAVALGIPVTIQQPLLHDTAEVEIGYWGQERVAQLFPAREWIDEGALVTAGSDFPVGSYGAMQSIWGMVTRQTVAGIQGPEHAITRDEGIRLHTTAAVELLGEDHLRGRLVPGKLADMTIWPKDPRSCPIDEMRTLQPIVTVIGGRVVHDAR